MSVAGPEFVPAGRAGRLEDMLLALLRRCPELEAAAVVSFDGLPMASALPAGMDEDRVAAMSAALLSLGERAAEGLGRGELSQVYIEGEHGTVYLVSADGEAVLVAVAAPKAKAGLVLYELRRAAVLMGTALRAADDDFDAVASAMGHATPVDTAPGAVTDTALVPPPTGLPDAPPAATADPAEPPVPAAPGTVPPVLLGSPALTAALSAALPPDAAGVGGAVGAPWPDSGAADSASTPGPADAVTWGSYSAPNGAVAPSWS